MEIADRVAAAKKAYDEAMNLGAMQSDAFHSAIAAAISVEYGDEEQPRYTTRRLYDEIRKAEERGRQYEREAALSAAEPVEQDENPMRFFADNVDKWGALEWFNRLVDACEDHDRKRIQAFRCADQDEKDMLSLSADTSKMIMSSSAFQLARKHKDEIRSALSAQVQDDDNRVAIDLGAAVLSKITDPAVRETAIRNALIAASNRAAQAQDVAGWQLVPKEPTLEMLKAMFEAMFEASFDGTSAPMIGAGYDAALAEAPAKQEG